MIDGEKTLLAQSKLGSQPKHAPADQAVAVQTEPLTIGHRLRAARLAAHLTQQELAGDFYSKSYVSAIERGKLTPSFQALGRLAERLALPISYLLGESKIDLEALEKSSILLRGPFDQARQADETEALLRLGAAEDFIRNDRPHEALEELGGRDEPPGTWPLVHYPTWYWLAGWASGLEGRNDEAIRLLERGFHLAESLYLRAPNSQRARLAEQVERLRCFLGTAYCADGQTALALQCHLQGREAIDKQIITDADLKLMIYKGLGREYLAQGRYQEAAVFYQLAIKSAHDRADQRQHGLAAWGLGLAYREQGNLQQARKSYLEALEALGAHGNRQLLAQIRALLGQVLVNLKEYEEAEHHLQRSLEGARYVKDPRLVGIALANLADLHLARGAPEQAIQAAQEGLPLVQQSEDYRSVGELQYTLALAYAAMQKNEAAERAYHAAIRTAGQISDRDILGQVHQGYADFLASQGRFQQAFAILQQMSSALPSEQSILKRDAIVSSNVGTKHK